jgi:hypothetical protein
MEVTGKIIVALPEVSGTSRAGNAWKKREYVLETQETYPRKIHFDFFGERADQFPLNVGDTIKLSFDIESREYNGRWYTGIHGWKSEPATVAAPAAGYPAAAPGAAPAFPAAPAYGAAPAPTAFPGAAPSAPNDDLPF